MVVDGGRAGDQVDEGLGAGALDPRQVPSARAAWARASIAAHARAASSEGKVPSHLSTPGSSAHRRRPQCSRACLARWTTRSGLTRASTVRHRRRSCGAASVSQVLAEGGDDRGRDRRRGQLELVGDHRARYASSPPVRIASCSPPSPVSVPTRPARRRPPDRGPHPALGVHRGHHQRPGHDRRRVQRHVPRRPVVLHHGAVIEQLGLDRGQRDDRLVLHRGRHVHHPLAGRDHMRPLRDTPMNRSMPEAPTPARPRQPRTPQAAPSGPSGWSLLRRRLGLHRVPLPLPQY